MKGYFPFVVGTTLTQLSGLTQQIGIITFTKHDDAIMRAAKVNEAKARGYNVLPKGDNVVELYAPTEAQLEYAKAEAKKAEEKAAALAAK